MNSNNTFIIFTKIIGLTAFLLQFNTGYSQNEVKDCYNLAKSYSAIQYFYPSPQLADLNWDNFLTYQVDNILKDSFYLETALHTLTKDIALGSADSKNTNTISPEHLIDNYYYQHFGGIETYKGESKDEVIKSIIVGDDLKSFSMLFRRLPMSDKIDKRIKVSFYAKWESVEKDSALVMLHSGFKKGGKMNSRYQKSIIKPSSEWKYYESVFDFCENCPKRILNSLKIVRPENDTLLIDDLIIVEEQTNDTIFHHDFENFDTLYNQYSEYQAFTLSKSIAPDRSRDRHSGDYALKLVGNRHLQLYPQVQLDSFIYTSLDSNYLMSFPRFLNKEAFKKQKNTDLSFYENLNTDSLSTKAVYIADIIKLWSIAENSYPYKSFRERLDSKKLLNLSISKALRTDYSSTDHFHNIVYIHSAYRDPHLNPNWKGKKPLQPPVIPQYVDGKYRISSIYDEDYKQYYGREVTHINNQSIENWVDERLFNKSEIESLHLLNNALRYFCYSFDNHSSYTFTLRNGEELVFGIKELIPKQKSLISPYSYLQDTIQVIGDNEAVYVRITPYISKWDKRDKERKRYIIDSLSKYPWIILDFRNRHINYTSQRVMEFKKRANKVFSQPELHSIIDNPFKKEFDYSALNIYDIARYEVDAIPFTPKIIVLINENTRSAPERHLLSLVDENLVTLVGQPTAGAAGFVSKLKLPSGIKVSFTMGNTVHNSGESYQGIGLKPDYFIDNSFSEQDFGLLKVKEIIANGKN
jgi:hypothetical protein